MTSIVIKKMPTSTEQLTEYFGKETIQRLKEKISSVLLIGKYNEEEVDKMLETLLRHTKTMREGGIAEYYIDYITDALSAEDAKERLKEFEDIKLKVA